MRNQISCLRLSCLLIAGISWAFQPFAYGSEPAAPQAYEFGGLLTLESLSNLKGGIGDGNRYLTDLHLNFAVDTTAAHWWNNGEWLIDLLGNYSQDPEELTGDLQGVSNIAAPHTARVYQLWYQHHFVDDKIKLLLGLHDFNASFYALPSAGLFTHPSFGIGPDTSQVGPSIFPTTALGAHLTVTVDTFYFLLASYDGIAGDPSHPNGTHIKWEKDDGLFNAVEAGFTKSEDSKLAIGIWQHTATVTNPVNGEITNQNSGFYFIGETRFAAKNHLFFQLGYADEDTNQLAQYLGLGVVRDGLFSQDDRLGLAVAHARNGSAFIAANSPIEQAETAWDFTYLIPLAENAFFQGSLIYITNPGMVENYANALALSARLKWEF